MISMLHIILQCSWIVIIHIEVYQISSKYMWFWFLEYAGYISKYHWIFSNLSIPGKMHMGSSAYILHLLLEYNEGIWTGLYVVDISWEIPILTFPAINTFYAMSNTCDSNLPVTVHIYSDVTTLVQCNRIPLKIFWNYDGTPWKYIHMT